MQENLAIQGLLFGALLTSEVLSLHVRQATLSDGHRAARGEIDFMLMRNSLVKDRMTERFEEEHGRDYVSSFARGLDIIRSFTRSKPRMTLSEVAERAEINRAAARRFLLTLVREGFADLDGKFFSLKPKILELGFSALASMQLPELAQPILDDLADKLQESCFCAVLDQEWAMYIAVANSRRFVNASVNVGIRAPAYCVASGRVLLASLKPEELDSVLQKLKPERFTENTVRSKLDLRSAVADVRNKGYAIVDQEFEVGLRSISVPIYDRSRSVIAALGVGCPSPRYTAEDLVQKVLPVLLDSASKITLSLPR